MKPEIHQQAYPAALSISTPKDGVLGSLLASSNGFIEIITLYEDLSWTSHLHDTARH